MIMSLQMADQNELLAQLNFTEREPVLVWQDIIRHFDAAATKGQAAHDLTARYAGKVKSISPQTIYRKRKAYHEDGILGLFPAAARCRLLDDASLDPHFVQFWQTLCGESQRVTAAAYRGLFHDHLCAGRCIPGYGMRPDVGQDWRGIWRLEHSGATPPAACPYIPDRVYPRGWSLRNLYHYAPSEYQTTAARIGTAAAREYLPKVPSTRVGLPFASVFVADDRFHDAKVKFAGNTSAHPVVELGALELLSGHYCSYGMKPIRERANGTREILREAFMRYLLVDILCRIGYHPMGCQILGEHGTARLPGPVQKLLEKITHGKVEFATGAILNKPIGKGLLPGAARGNFRFKAAVESAHNRYKNDLALLPGQKGADPAHAPEDLAAKDSYHRALMKAGVALAEQRPELIDHLRTPFPDYFQYIEAVGLLYDRIADDASHKLEGWNECGFVVPEFTLPGFTGPQPLALLDDMKPEDREFYLEMIRRDPARQINRRMTRREAFAQQQGCTELMRVSEAMAPAILGRDLGQDLAVAKDATLGVKDPYIPSKVHQVAAVAVLPGGCHQRLDRGTRWLVHLSPLNAREAYISTPDGVYVGKAPVLVPGTRIDVNHANMAIVNEIERAELKGLARIGEKRLRKMADDKEHNVRAITGRDVLQEHEANQRALEDAGEVDVTDEDLAAAYATERDDDLLNSDEISGLIGRA